VLSIAVGIDHYSFDFGCNGCGSDSVTPIGVTINYHLHLDNRKIDPFVGLGLGHTIVSIDNCGSVFGVAINCGGVEPPNLFKAHTSYWKLMLPPKLSLCAWLLAFTSSPARIAPYRFVLAPAPPVKETLPRTRISPYQFNPPLMSRSPSTIRMPDPLAAEVKWTLPGMYSVTDV